MIPLRDTIPSRRFPIVNTAIIVCNVLIFLFEALMGGDGLYWLIENFGLTPVDFWRGGWLTHGWTLFTSMFLHAGWLHLISNMLSLYIFGDNVEDRLGPVRYLLFYLSSGVAASAAHLITNAGSTIPTVGASGAIAGVLGAYLILYPRARVVTLVPIFYFIRVIQVPAIIYLLFWFFSQVFNGFLSLAAAVYQSGGVAWWAHIGGFVFGLAIIRLISPPVRPATNYADYADYVDRYRRPRW